MKTPPTISLIYKILALLCLLPGVCFGQGAHRIGQVLSRGSGVQANIVPYAQILVCPAGTNCATTSSLFSNIALTIIKPNPVTADANGVYDYYATPACYDEHISAPGVPAYTVFNVCSVNGSSTGLVLQHNGTDVPQQGLLNFNDISPTPPVGNTNVTFQIDSGGDLSGYVPTAATGVCPEGTCVVNAANATQTVTQPQNTTLQANVFQSQFYANLFGTGSNGIATIYNNPLDCIPQGHGISYGCSIEVPPLYTNSDVPAGWLFASSGFGNTISATQMPPGGSAYDSRNGTQAWYFHDPMNPTSSLNSGFGVRSDWDLNLQQRVVANAGAAASGAVIAMNEYAGGFDFNFYPFMTQFVNQDYRFGLNLTQDNWTDGIDFGELEILNHHGQGDAFLHWERLLCDGGILAGSSEGCGIADSEAGEDLTVFAGVITSVTPTAITVNGTQGQGTQGPERLFIDTQSASVIQGTVPTGAVDPQTTGSIGKSAIMPPQLIDTAQNFPVSTMFQLCNAGSNNGASGAAGCTAGNQPTGVIPPTPLTVTITSGSVTGGVATFVTAAQSLVAGQTVLVYSFSGAGVPLNNVSGTVSATGLSSTGFQMAVSVGNITSTGAGRSTESPTGFSPPQSIVLNVVAPYTGTGGDTNGTPAGFCTSSTLQSSNSGASCYLPASGVLYLTDGVEYESDNYTYNSGAQQVTITNMMFPHLNGVVGAYGGLAGWALQDNANLVNSSSGVGVVGTIAPTYSLAGSVSPTSIYYVPQRTNEQYGLPTMGVMNTSNAIGGWGAQLYFNVAMSGFSISGGVVTFNMSNPPNATYPLSNFNGLKPNIVVSSNTTYSCSNCAITWLHDNVFSYTPSAPSGSTPTTGTITYNNDSYTIYPAVRVKSVYDTSNNSVDGKLTVYPFNTPFTVGDVGREAHYQKLQLAGRRDTVNEIQPEDFLGESTESVTYGGFFQGAETGFDVINETAVNSYAGYGGTRQLPFYGYGLNGIWATDFAAFSAPDQTLLGVIGCKFGIGCSAANSNFNVLLMPPLASQSAQPGVNGEDALNYDPNYMSSTRPNGTHSGLWSFSNGQAPPILETGGFQYYSTIRFGYGIVDQQINTPTLVTSNVSTTQITSITTFFNPITTGSTTYNYWVVGHGINNVGTTSPIAAVIHNGNATPDNMLCIPHQPGFSSYDILKGSTSLSIITGLSAVGNGLSVSPVQPANYSCFLDTGGSTTAYVPPTSNTTGGGHFLGPIVGNGFQNTSVSVAGCAQYDSSGNESSTGTACGSGGGGGSVTSVAMTVPSWLTVAGSPITSTGTFAVSGTSEPQNEFVATPNGSSGAVSPRAIVAADIPTLNQSTTGTAANVTGIVAAANGGTGLNSGSSTGVPQVASGTWTISTTLPSGLTAASMTLTSPTMTAPVLGTPASGVGTNLTGIPLNSAVTGNLPNANLATVTANSVLGATSATTPSDLPIPSCSGGTNALTFTLGTGFGCNTISGGISGLTSGFLPIAGSGTSLTGNSHLDDGVTTASTITSSEQVAAPGFATTGSSPKITMGTGGPTWTVGSADPAGTCVTGSIYSNSSGASGHVFWACVGSAWVDVK